jgi:dTDP-4-dehydrorhamnose reductase
MKILVTGAHGQVGSELVAQGEVLGLEMLVAGRSELDVSQQDKVEQYIQANNPDIVINAAAYTAVDRAESEPGIAYAINRDGVVYLSQVCADNKIPLLHISTDYVFDGLKNGSYLESDTPNPQGIYGQTKLEGDQAIETLLKEYIILRVSWVFGERGNNFVKTMLRLGKEKDVLSIVSDQRGGPTWAGDIASTLLSIAKRWNDGEMIPWGTYHFCGEPIVSWKDFADEIFKNACEYRIITKSLIVNAITTAEFPALAKRPLNSSLDCRRIKQRLGVEQPDWRTGLKVVLKNWKEG